MAQIRNVEFFQTGQEGWTDYYDPRYSVAFLNLGEVQTTHQYIGKVPKNLSILGSLYVLIMFDSFCNQLIKSVQKR